MRIVSGCLSRNFAHRSRLSSDLYLILTYGRIPETGPPLPPAMVHGWFYVSALDLLISISSPIVALCFLATRPQIWKPPGLPRSMHHGMDLLNLLRSSMVGSVYTWADRNWSTIVMFMFAKLVQLPSHPQQEVRAGNQAPCGPLHHGGL